MNSKLTSAAIAAVIFASSPLAMAQQNGAQDPASPSSATPQQQQQSQTDATQKKVTKKVTTKKKQTQKAKTDAAEEAKKKGEETDKTGKPDEPLSERVERGTKEAGEATTRMQEDIVGRKAQSENERRAREKRESDAKAEADARKTGEAVGKATTTAATTIVDTAQDVSRATDEPGKYNPLAVSWNPLGLIVGGRVSFNVEYAPVTHHVIIVSPHFANPSQDVNISPDVRSTNRFTGFGGEIGYRYYTGHKGMNGIFIGPSLVGGVYNASLVAGDTAFTNFGVAADVGVQKVFWDHLALGAGAGIEYLNVSKDFGDLSAGPSTIASSGLKPRLLAQAGYAF